MLKTLSVKKNALPTVNYVEKNVMKITCTDHNQHPHHKIINVNPA